MPIEESIIKFSKEEINKQVDKICQSGELVSKNLLCQLLKYLVNETLAGRQDNLKGYTIGVDVFNKEDDFDAEHDPLHDPSILILQAVGSAVSGIDDNIGII